MSEWKTSPFHDRKIPVGVYGELSKVREELEEAQDAFDRGQDLLLMIELADIIGAVAGVAESHGYPFESLLQFSELVRSIRSTES